MKTIGVILRATCLLLAASAVSHAATCTVSGFSQSNIQSCIDSSNSGDTVVLPPGTYNLNGALACTKLLTFRGTRAQTILHAGPNNALTFTENNTGVEGCSYINMVFDAGGIDGLTCKGTIQGNYFKNPGGHGNGNSTLIFYAGADGCVIDSNVYVGVQNNPNTGGGSAGVLTLGPSMNSSAVTNNFFDGFYQGFSLQQNGPVGFNNHIDNNTFLHAVRANMELTSPFRNSTVNNNYIALGRKADPADFDGTGCDPANRDGYNCSNFGLSFVRGGNNVLNNNKFYGEGVWAAELEQTDPCGGSFSGNIIKDWTFFAIDDDSASNGASCFRPFITGNTTCGGNPGLATLPGNTFYSSCSNPSMPVTAPIPCAPFNPNTGLSDNSYPVGCGSVIIPPSPDFTITALPSSRTLAAGGSSNYTATIAAVNGFTGTVTFGASGFPGTTTSGYGFRRPITIDHTQVGGGNLTNVPVLVSGTLSYLKSVGNGGNVQNANGWDITFSSDAGGTNILKFDRAIWNATTGTVEYWVNVPAVSSTVDTTFYMFYSNAGVASDPQAAALTYGTDAVSNHHFQDGTTLTLYDAVRSTNDTSSGTVTAGSGQIDGAAAFSNGLVSAGIPGFSGALTVSAWVFPTATSGDSTIVANNNGGTQNYAIWLTDTTHVEVTGASGVGLLPVSPAWTLNAWNYVVWTLDGTNSKIYINGTLANTTASTSVAGSGPGSLLIGRDNAIEPFPGRLDEVRIFSSAHSAGFITAEYNNQKSSSTFLSIGSATTLSGSATTFAFSPATISTSGNSTLNFTLPSDATIGNYTIVITASSGSLVHTVNTGLTVQAPPTHITNLSASSITNTQAILKWNVDTSPSGCSVEASKSPTYTPLARDVDPVLFVGSNLATRIGSIISGTNVTFVLGTRKTERGADGRRYSRALQSGTQYYVRITCSGVQAATQFTTAQIPIGSTWVDQTQADPLIAGEWLQPSVSFTDRTEEYVDPHTGDLIKRVSLANDQTNRETNRTYTFGFGSGWTNPANGTTVNGVFATIANSTAKLALTGPTGTWSSIHAPNFGQTPQDEYVPVMYQSSISMKSSNAACTAGNTNPICAMNVCVTADGVSCAAEPVTTASQISTFQITNVLAGYQIGSGTDGDMTQSTPRRPFNQVESAFRNGTLTCDGSSTATWASGDLFPGTWTAGSSIQISVLGLPVMFSIASYTNTRALALGSNCASGTWSFTGVNFGVLVWRAASNTDTISVDGGTINYVLGLHRAPPDYSGAYNQCSDTTVVGPTGNAGYTCTNDYAGGAQVFWIDATTGESHIFAKLGGTFVASPFKPGAPDSWYIDTGGGNIQLKTYVGDHLEPTAGQTDHSGEAIFGIFDGDLFTCNGTTHTTRCYNVLNLTTTGNTMGDLTAAFNPAYDKVKFAAWGFQQVESGILHWTAQTAANGLGWNVVFDPAATTNGQPGNAGCLTNGNPGCVIATMPSWSSPGCRWCTIKAGTPLYVTDWVMFTPYFDQTLVALGTGQGPFVVRAVGTIPDATTTCPANSYGQTNNCVTITVDGEVIDFGEGTGSRGSYGNAAIGDQVQFPAIGTHYNSESMILLGKSGNNWTFARNYNGAGQIPGATLGSNAYIQFTCTNIYPGAADNSLRGKEEQWNFRNDIFGLNGGGTTIVNSANGVNAHYYNDYGTAAYSYSQDTRCTATFGCYQGQKISTSFPDLLAGITPITGLTTQGPVFQGVTAPYNNGGWQSHPWSAGGQATSDDKRFFFDSRPFLGFSGLTSTVNLVSGQLYKAPAGTTTLNRKFMPTLALAGPHPLLDISNATAGNVIGTGTSDAWKYCVVVVAGECRTGSAAGDVYFNIPGLTFMNCQYYGGNALQVYEDVDVCIADASSMSNATVRIPLDRFDMTGRETQVLTHGMSRPHYTDPFWHGHPLGNGRWIYNYTQNLDGYASGEVISAVPPVSRDSTNRTGFIPMNVGVPAGASNVVVEFGYAENGSTLLNCTSRDERCAVGAATNPGQIQSTPFWFESSESASLAGTPCSTGCNIAVPALPGHVLYWQIAFRDSSHNVIRRSALAATAIY